MGYKSKSFSSLIIIIFVASSIILVKPAYAETSEPNPNWVEVFRFSGNYTYFRTESSDLFTVSHSELRVQWYISAIPATFRIPVIDDLSKYSFEFSIYRETKPQYFEQISNVSGRPAFYDQSGTLSINNNQYRNFQLYSYFDNPISQWTMVVEENTNSPLIDITAPSISIISPENKTYRPENISLTFNVNEATSDMQFSLDNLANVTTVGNTTLTNLSEGSHSLAVYASDNAGNLGKSETVNFTITKESQLVTFPIIALIIVIVLLAVAIGLIVYFKKRKGQTL
jgi:hypothetical protein